MLVFPKNDVKQEKERQQKPMKPTNPLLTAGMERGAVIRPRCMNGTIIHTTNNEILVLFLV